MKKYFLFSALGLLSLFASCRQDDGLDSSNSDYTELTLSISAPSSEEEARVAAYHDGGKLKFTFNHPAPNAAVKTRKVKTEVYNGSEKIFEQDLDWTIALNGTRLTYDGPIRIKASQLSPNRGLMVKATTITDTKLLPPKDGPGNTYEAGDYARYSDYYNNPYWEARVHAFKTNGGVVSAKEVYPPFEMYSEVKQEGPKLVIADASTAKFKPQGTFVNLTIQNNMAVPTFAAGVRVEMTNGDANTYLINTEFVYPGYIPSTVKRDELTNNYFYSSEAFPTITPQEGLIAVGPGGGKSSVTALVWIPYVEGDAIKSISTVGPAQGTAVLDKQPSKSGQVINAKVTVEPGELLEPFGIYTSSERVVQYWIDMEGKQGFDSYVEKTDYNTPAQTISQALAKMKQINPDAYVPSLYQFSYLVNSLNEYLNGLYYGATDLNSDRHPRNMFQYKLHPSQTRRFMKNAFVHTSDRTVAYSQFGNDAAPEYQILSRVKPELYPNTNRDANSFGPDRWGHANIRYSFLPYEEGEHVLTPEYWEGKRTTDYVFPLVATYSGGGWPTGYRGTPTHLYRVGFATIEQAQGALFALYATTYSNSHPDYYPMSFAFQDPSNSRGSYGYFTYGTYQTSHPHALLFFTK